MNNQESVLGDYVLQLQKQKEERERKRREQEEAEERKRREEEERQAASARRLRLEEEERLREEKKAKAAKWFLIVLGIIIVVVVVVLLIQKNIEKKQYQIALAEAKAYIASGDSCVAIYHFGEAQEFYDKAKHSKAEQEVRSEIMRKETVLQEAQNKANQEYNDALRRLKIFLDADDGKFNDISSACLDKMIQIYPDRKETKYFQQLRKETGNVNKTNTSKVNTNIGVNTTVHTDSHVSMEDAERIKQEQKNRAATLRAEELRNKIEDLTKKFEENSFLSRERAEHAQVELKKLQQELQNIESSTINSQTSSSVEKKSTENELLCEQKVCSSVKLLSNLRAVSAAVSGTNRKKSFIERIPSFLRIIIFLVMFVLTLSSRSIPVCTLMFVLSVIYARISNLKIKKLISSYLKILPFLLFFTIIQLILKAPLEGEKAYISLKWFYVTKSKLLFCLASILRTYSALGCISAFFVSTPEYDLIDGLNILLFPLKISRIPVKYFIIIVEIVFRFIPVLIDEASSIIKTQVIRGALGKTKGVFAKIKAIIPLIVPLIVQTIKKSESLADAITMRCFK